MRFLQPTGAKGDMLKSKGPLKYSHAKIFGLAVAWRNTIIVSLAWGSRRSQRYRENAASTATRNERKSF